MCWAGNNASTRMAKSIREQAEDPPAVRIPRYVTVLVPEADWDTFVSLWDPKPAPVPGSPDTFLLRCPKEA